jgi:chaperone modulatory protein CbpM
MQTEDLIAANDFCTYYKIEYAFIDALNENGLITITTIHEDSYISASELHRLEQFVRLHTDLDINLEGIEAISHLLQKIEEMQNQITALKNKLRMFEVENNYAK